MRRMPEKIKVYFSLKVVSWTRSKREGKIVGAGGEVWWRTWQMEMFQYCRPFVYPVRHRRKITGFCHKRLILIRISRPKSEEISLQYQLTTSSYCLHSSAWCKSIFFPITVELNAVTEDNKVLKQRIQILESELKKWVRETLHFCKHHP